MKFDDRTFKEYHYSDNNQIEITVFSSHNSSVLYTTTNRPVGFTLGSDSLQIDTRQGDSEEDEDVLVLVTPCSSEDTYDTLVNELVADKHFIIEVFIPNYDVDQAELQKAVVIGSTKWSKELWDETNSVTLNPDFALVQVAAFVDNRKAVKEVHFVLRQVQQAEGQYRNHE